MKAILLQHYGRLDALQIADIPTPTPEKGQVLVKVKAFTISPLELKIRRGEAKMFVRRKLPMVMGSDFAGDVVEVGEGVSNFKVGDAVLGSVDPFKQAGPYAEYVAVTERQICPKPDNLTYEIACTLPIAGMSALQCLRDLGKLRAGQHVLILGAAGAVGHIGVQLAKNMGATVTAVCRGENADFVLRCGADNVIDYIRQDVFTKFNTYDVVFDAVDKYPFSDAQKALKNGGIYVNTMPKPARMLSSLLNPFRSKKMALLMMKSNSNDMLLVTKMAAAGVLKINLDKVYEGFESIHQATEKLEAEHVRGKLVIRLA